MIPVSPTPAWKHLGVSYYFVVSANLTCIPVDIGEVEVVMTKSLDISPLTAVLVSSEESTRDVCTSRYVPVSERARLDLDGQDELTVIILADSRIRHDGIVALSPLADSQLESLTDGNVAAEGNGRDLGIARILRVVADTRRSTRQSSTTTNSKQ